eukprot:CAMPEP_0114586080 /NCGR_PEP_ID=MMETSP0125-20121206/9413_1 /TAXON_ID=485358 ORGANISM="Aristerostoma sp., Strain ATCC 50986" /NCGR_SAMPLE_ID=MMETSP0125 /ASSEMBLY_ACC=CAM_ASM_000245 /LENGTH=39 /DNA_ID= /DNA_START= /DNA_END= /DNA_ORIENTATION=
MASKVLTLSMGMERSLQSTSVDSVDSKEGAKAYDIGKKN